jgi:hypothetical protein
MPRPEKSFADQSWELQQRFKATGIVPPQTEWQPKPTAGDMSRALAADIIAERDEQMPFDVDEQGRLWNHPHSNRRAPHGDND